MSEYEEGGRHAARHWLTIQAREAVEIAVGLPEPRIPSPEDKSFVEDWRREALREAARHLRRAEALARRIARLR